MKRILKFLWNEFVFGGHLAASGTVIIALSVMVFADRVIPFAFYAIVYLLTYIAYMFDRYLDTLPQNANDPRITHLLNRKKLVLFSIILSVILIIVLLQSQSSFAILGTLLLLLVGLCYNLFLKKLTRIIPAFKSCVVSISYSITILLISAFDGKPINTVLVLLFCFFLLRVFANTAFCDIKDREEDCKEGLKTLAVMLSPNKLWLLLYAINALSAIPIVLGVIYFNLDARALLLLVTIPYALLYYYLAKKEKVNIHTLANSWADGELLVWLSLTIGGLILWKF